MKINKLAKKVFEIRKALGYATPYQILEGPIGEERSCKYLIKEALKLKPTHELSCGGFRYVKLKSGSIRVIPDFSFIVKNGDL